MPGKLARKSKYWVYIVKCKDGTYYTGITNDLDKRIERHNEGYGAKYLKGKLPVKLVYTPKSIVTTKMVYDVKERLKN